MTRPLMRLVLPTLWAAALLLAACGRDAPSRGPARTKASAQSTPKASVQTPPAGPARGATAPARGATASARGATGSTRGATGSTRGATGSTRGATGSTRGATTSARSATAPLAIGRRFEGYARTVLRLSTGCGPGELPRPPRSQAIRDEAAYREFTDAIIQPGALPEVKRTDPLGARPQVDFSRRMIVVALCELNGCTGIRIADVQVRQGAVVARVTRRRLPANVLPGRDGHFAYQAVEVPRRDGPVRFELTDR